MSARCIRTGRLALRPLAPTDLDAVHALWTQPGVRRFLFDDVTIPRPVAAEMLAESGRLMHEMGRGLWAAFLREPDVGAPLVGTGGFWHFGTPPEPEILWALDDDRRGRGYATEMSRAMLRWAFDHLGFARVVAATDVPNVDSERVMQRIGMRFRERRVRDGLDTVFYELTREDFAPGTDVFELEAASRVPPLC